VAQSQTAAKNHTPAHSLLSHWWDGENWKKRAKLMFWDKDSLTANEENNKNNHIDN